MSVLHDELMGLQNTCYRTPINLFLSSFVSKLSPAEAREVAGKVVPYVIEQNKDLSEMSLHVITIFSDSIREDGFDVLTLATE